MSSLYDTDFYAWTNQQAALLRAGKLSAADIDNIAEEIESMGRSERRELASRLEVLLTHLLKWQFQPDGRSGSWRGSIVEQRRRIADVLEESPSLRRVLPALTNKAYEGALAIAEAETSLPLRIFPEECPWSFEQAMAPDFWPE